MADMPGGIVAELNISLEQFLNYSRNFLQCVETEVSLPHSQQTASCPCSELDKVIPLLLLLLLLLLFSLALQPTAGYGLIVHEVS
jgi:hypothetical protein